MHALVNQSDAEQDAASLIRRLLDEGEYGPGDRLPSERELTERFGLTRSALRKGLNTLESEKLIWRHVGKGTFVASDQAGSSASGLTDLCRSVSPLHMMRSRLAVEPAIAREAAINASAEAAERIRKRHELAMASESWDDYEAEDDHMHRAVAEATDNALLVALFEQLNQVRRAVAWDNVIRTSERPPKDHTSFDQHERIVRAIETRSPAEAQEAMRAHLASVAARLFGDL